jgi:hypothetical protein
MIDHEKKALFKRQKAANDAIASQIKAQEEHSKIIKSLQEHLKGA